VAAQPSERRVGGAAAARARATELTPDEAACVTAKLRPQVEAGTLVTRLATAYLLARKS
jgi:hypothetical protein